MSYHIKILILTLALLVGGLLSYTLVKNGYFPVAKVGNHFISYRTARENVEISRKVYNSGLAGFNPELEVLFDRANDKELLKNALENLIISQVIKSSASRQVLDKAKQEVSGSFKNTKIENLAQAIQTIYGWNVAEFKTRVLEPQALMEVTAKEKGSDFRNWLNSQKNQAKIKIWFLPFEWKNGQLITINN